MSIPAQSFIKKVEIGVMAKELTDQHKIIDRLRQQHGRAMQQLKAKFPTFFTTSGKKSQEIDKKISKVSKKSVITIKENSKEVPEDPAKEVEKIQGEFPIVEEKFPIVEEKFPIVEEKYQAAGDKLQTAPNKQKINHAIQQSQNIKDLKQTFLDLISAPDLPWTFGETLDFDTFQITFTVKTK